MTAREEPEVEPAALDVPARPAWYALRAGSWRDYVTILHLPYSAWHLSYVVIGGCLAPVVAWGRLGAAVGAFALAVGIGAHALDELNGRPLRTRIPDAVLLALAAASIGAACAIGVVGAAAYEPWLALLVPVGLFLVLAYNLELAGGRFHTDLWFGLAWGGFPVLCGYAAVAGDRHRGGARLGLRGAALARPARPVESRPPRPSAGGRGPRHARPPRWGQHAARRGGPHGGRRGRAQAVGRSDRRARLRRRRDADLDPSRRYANICS
jgi:hypothetical protein